MTAGDSTLLRVRLSAPQHRFVSAPEQFPAMVAGFGAGKTQAGVWRALTKKLAYPTCNVAYYLPTYDLVARTAFPRFEELLEKVGVPYKLNRNDSVLKVEGSGEVIFRTMDVPSRIVSFEVADSIVDELDTLPVDKASDVWNRVISRNRQKKPDGARNTVGVVTTPEGFRFVYRRWKQDVKPGYRLITASTMSNAENLPDGYIESLRSAYPTNLLAAYLDGAFVNMTSGSVYAEFDRLLNATPERIKSNEREKETLHIGMDFNVGKMAAVVHVLRGDDPHAVDELTNILDTPAMIKTIQARYEGHPVMIYPDASGSARKSNNASQSDISLLSVAKFRICVNPSNPAVKDRVLSVNALINTDGKRRYRVNPETCPQLVESLEKQAYDKNGEPDKTAGFDHMLDAAGYFVVYRYPIVRRVVTVSRFKV